MNNNTATTLRCASNLALAKRCTGTGAADVKPSDMPAYFVPYSVPVNSLDDMYRLLADDLQHNPRKCLVRGGFIGREAAALVPPREADGKIQHASNGKGGYRRWSDLFEDVPGHVVMFDVDSFIPQTADPALEPEKAIVEWVRHALPPEFQNVSFVWQLSSRAGFVPGELKVHVWFWFEKAASSASLKRWARTINKAKGSVLDESLYSPVQIHYTANPIFENGVIDPVSQRVGLYRGSAGDSVDLDIHIEPAVDLLNEHRMAVSINAALGLGVTLPDFNRMAAAEPWWNPNEYSEWSRVLTHLKGVTAFLDHEQVKRLAIAYSNRANESSKVRNGESGTNPEDYFDRARPLLDPEISAATLLRMAKDGAISALNADIKKGNWTAQGIAARKYLGIYHRAAYEQIKKEVTA